MTLDELSNLVVRRLEKCNQLTSQSTVFSAIILFLRDVVRCLFLRAGGRKTPRARAGRADSPEQISSLFLVDDICMWKVGSGSIEPVGEFTRRIYSISASHYKLADLSRTCPSTAQPRGLDPGQFPTSPPRPEMVISWVASSLSSNLALRAHRACAVLLAASHDHLRRAEGQG